MKATLVPLLLWATAGCSGPADVADPIIPVDEFMLPEPDGSLDPTRLSVGEIIASHCSFPVYGSGLAHFDGRHEWVTVDVYPGTAGLRPLSEGEVEQLEELGVRVLHLFNIAAVRGRVLYSALSELVQGVSGGIVVRSVPDASRFDIPSVVVGYDRFEPTLQPSLAEEFRDRGGLVTHEMEAVQMIAGILPDRSVSDIEKRRDVRFIEVSGIGCLGG